jgi:hypothetical protein
MNFTTSSYVEVDLNPLDSAVVLRSASGDGWAAANETAATTAATARKGRIRVNPPAAMLPHLRLPRASQEIKRSRDQEVNRRSGDQELMRSLGSPELL